MHPVSLTEAASVQKVLGFCDQLIQRIHGEEAAALDEAYEEMEDGQNQLLGEAQYIKSTKNATYFAFTATPKSETMELFGTRTEEGKTYFDKYTMKQAM